MLRSDFATVPVTDQGTQNPIVARLSMQIFDLLDCWIADKENKDQIKTLCFDLINRLLRCEEIIKSLKEKTERVGWESDELNEQNGGQIVSIPHIVSLDREAETFLYEAKNYLRELLKVINLMHSTNFRNASSFVRTNKDDQEMIKDWAERLYGADDGFTRRLSQDQEWISEVIKKRNAVEHPGGYSGTLHIENVKLVEGELVAPTWHRDANDPLPIFQDLVGTLDNLLTFTEDIIVLGIKKNPVSEGIVFIEIPEEERNPSCPVRLKIGLDPAYISS